MHWRKQCFLIYLLFYYFIVHLVLFAKNGCARINMKLGPVNYFQHLFVPFSEIVILSATCASALAQKRCHQ